MQNYISKLKIWQEWKSTVLLCIGIIILALLLRLYNLTILPIFGDEAIYVRWAQVMRAEPTLRFLPLSDGKQPFFMWSIIPFLKVFTDPLSAGRVTSVASGMGTLVGVFVLTYLFFKSKKASLLASLAYAISPFSVFFDRMALVDSMLAFFGIWTLIFALLSAKTLRLDFAMLAGFALGGALLTKSPAIFFAILLPTTWLLSPWPKEKGRVLGGERLIHLIKLLSLFLVTYFISLAMYNILRLGPNFHMIGIRNQDYVFPLSHLWTSPKDPFIFYFHRSLQWLWILGPSTLYILAALGIALNFKKNKKEVGLLLVWFLFPLAVQSEFAKVFTARYIYFSIPLFFVISALPLASSVFREKEGLIKKFVVFVLVFFILQALWFDSLLLTDPEGAPLPKGERSGYLEEWTAGTGIKEVSEILREDWKAERGEIVVGTEGYFGTLPDGLQAYLNDIPEIKVIGVGLGLNRVPDALLDSKKAGNRTYLVVNSSRLQADPEELGLKLLAAYPKAFRRTDAHEYTLYGPRETLYFFEITGAALSPKQKS